MRTNFGRKNLKGGNLLKDLVVGAKIIILKWSAFKRIKTRTSVGRTVMSRRVP
jgi:hypothetical protein